MSEFEPTLREVLAAGHAARFRASGDSMYPAIRSGDYLYIVPCDASKLRAGDIRHCFAAVGKAEQEIGFVAKERFGAGLAELAEWVAQQEADDRVDEARRELEARGLVA